MTPAYEQTCIYPGCGAKRHVTAGWCSGHHRQVRDGEEPRPIYRSLEERFFAKVNKTETCWLWIGATNHLGYGQLWDVDTKRVDMAHRVSVRMSGREIPDGWEVDHLCRIPSCVNPEHLEPVTHAVNMERAPASAIQFQRAKTHCPQGHEYTPDNIYKKTNSSGGISRECRACKADAQRRYRAKKRARRLAAEDAA